VAKVKDIQVPIQVITNIHYVNLHEDTKDLNPRLEAFIHKTGDQMKRSTNLQADMTWFNTHSEEFEELHKIIAPYLGKFFVSNNTKKELHMTPEFIETWGASYHKDDYTRLHTHEPCKLSWIYYVKVSENTAPLYIHQIVNDKKERETFMIPPKISDLVMFPSWTPHSVPKQKTDEERICVAGNVNLSWKKSSKENKKDVETLIKDLDLPI
tara:strand:+ start:55 stop:687 length:633 start_codon:yes stop_codon:yes gene_type:complete